VNLCLDYQRETKVDVVLLLVMFSWIAVMMGCVIQFISHNNREMERHKSYIHGLDRVLLCVRDTLLCTGMAISEWIALPVFY